MKLGTIVLDRKICHCDVVYRPLHSSQISEVLRARAAETASRIFMSEHGKLSILHENEDVEPMEACEIFTKAEEMQRRGEAITSGMKSTLNPKG